VDENVWVLDKFEYKVRSVECEGCCVESER
jgi:hypothetical protein